MFAMYDTKLKPQLRSIDNKINGAGHLKSTLSPTSKIRFVLYLNTIFKKKHIQFTLMQIQLHIN